MDFPPFIKTEVLYDVHFFLNYNNLYIYICTYIYSPLLELIYDLISFLNSEAKLEFLKSLISYFVSKLENLEILKAE